MTASPATRARDGALAALGGALGFATVEGLVTLAVGAPRQLGTALSFACLDLGLSAVLFLCVAPAFAALGAARRRGAPPQLGRRLALLVALGLVVAAALRFAVFVHPPLQPHVPWRHLLAAVAFGAGAVSSARWASRAPRVSLSALGLGLALGFGGLGAEPSTKSLAVSHSPPLASLIALVRKAHDVDGDGYGTLLGENDCAPFDSRVHPLARELPDNGVDENCDGRDLRLESLMAESAGRRLPVPEGFRGDYNVLLLTLDSVRYDHTSLGGHAARRGRDTTPNLARLAARSASFAFANAPSAGTMASVPSILTSKFFHSGIALDEKVTPGMPPRLEPENVLLAELMKRKGYATGAILGHVYFADFGLQQGFDSYDNELGRAHDPHAVTSDRLTDKAIAWIGERGERKWFLWVHYLDPHAHYVPHPGYPSFGSSEEDRYDGELAFTDHHVGRLLERVPERTVIVVTADHGDGFLEHGFTNHGQALYFELLHVPLVVHVPGIEPRVIEGPVSPIDLVPTLADLSDVDVSDLSFEGESLVPQLFYRQDAKSRAVYAETNWPRVLRAVVTDRHKLVYRLEDNVYELFDLEADPREQKNLWPSAAGPSFEPLRRRLDDWLERVYYARDVRSNQVMAKLDGVLLKERPKPAFPLRGVRLDQGRVEVLGFDVQPPAKVSVYVHVVARPSAGWQLELEAVGPGGASARKPPLTTIFPPSRWRVGELVRSDFDLALPKSERARSLSLLRVVAGAPSEVVRLGTARL